MDADFRDDVARLEERIESLSESIERCRKLSFAAKLAIGAGAVWIVLTLTLTIPYVPYMTVAAMAATIGGVVLLGSNATTWTQMEAARQAAETMRADMIERMELRIVDAGLRRIH